ncbi:MAG: aspartate aminotransferase family protein [Clostridia bacterium]|nr:aspartate aminotransferase family protein [Clostridia bacterium]
MMLDQIKETDRKYYMNTFGERLPVCFTEGNGMTLTATNGKVYYDFMAGIAVNCLGHNHPRLVETICNQAKKLIHTSSLYYIESQANLAKLLCENSCADKAFFANSGAEANEGALKLARKYFYNKGQNKPEVITLINSFHGRTLATVSATGQEKYQKPYAPLVEKFVHVPANDIAAFKAAVTDKTGAVMLEVIQGESGVRPLEKAYLQEIRKICTEKDIVLIFDEVQTGMGRCGTLFAYETVGVEPDIFTLAKALAGGVPIGAILCKEQFAAFTPGDHGTTFGGNPLATAAGVCVVNELLSGVLENAKEMGSYFMEKLNTLKEKFSIIKEVRGKGLMIGVEFGEPVAKALSKQLFEAGFLVGTVGESVFRLVPPLIITKTEIDLLTDKLCELLNAL